MTQIWGFEPWQRLNRKWVFNMPRCLSVAARTADQVPLVFNSIHSFTAAAGSDAAACLLHTDEQGILSESPHHERHCRSHQPADPECHTGQAQLC